MLVFPNIKINIGLNIVEKRPDGYHNLETIFYPLAIHDILEIQEANQTSIEVSGLPIETSATNNLCIKAYQLLKEIHPNLPSIKIHLHKIIPTGAGLGGGSANAAYTLTSLNKLYKLNHTHSQLEEYASRLGSDCAFFIRNQAVYASGRGEIFTPIDLNLQDYSIILIKPPIHSSTAEAFSGIRPRKPKENLINLIQEPISEWKNKIKNDFEETLFMKYPILNEIKETLYQTGAIFASMSGSGTTLFGIFPKENNYEYLQKKFTGYFLCKI